jgi:hypothetical protein|tara:strand:+ start:1109 stop:1366 length:258 start_codon:yes stop_codon:yes gene_type:complete
MEDKRKYNGGHKTAGRKSKSEEIQLLEKLGALEPLAFMALEQGLERGDFKFTQLFYNYYAGKPRETKDITVTSEQPIFNIDLDDI